MCPTSQDITLMGSPHQLLHDSYKQQKRYLTFGMIYSFIMVILGSTSFLLLSFGETQFWYIWIIRTLLIIIIIIFATLFAILFSKSNHLDILIRLSKPNVDEKLTIV